MLLFKNHNKDLEIIDSEIIFSPSKISSILYSDPFLKAGFFSKLVQDTKIKILYLDFDLLFSGYLVSGDIKAPPNLTLFQPILETWNEILSNILTTITLKKSLVIIDSLNSLYIILNKKQRIGKLVNSYLMLLATMARYSGSYIVIANMARFKKEEGWTLSPSGNRLIETNLSKKILLDQDSKGVTLDFFDGEKKTIPFSLIPLF